MRLQADDDSASTHEREEYRSTGDTPTESVPVTENQFREWRRWIVESVLTTDYAVVPVDHLVDTIVDRDPDDVDHPVVRAALTEYLLPELDRHSVLEYDDDRELLIKYDN